MEFPKTPQEMIDAGYVMKRKNLCRGCKADIEWWATPRGKMMPVNPGTATPHWSTCPNADDFRKSR